MIITNGKSCNNDSIVPCYAKSKHLLLHHFFVLLRHYYTWFYYYPLLPISISQTCRWIWRLACRPTDGLSAAQIAKCQWLQTHCAEVSVSCPATCIILNHPLHLNQIVQTGPRHWFAFISNTKQYLNCRISPTRTDSLRAGFSEV